MSFKQGCAISCRRGLILDATEEIKRRLIKAPTAVMGSSQAVRNLGEA